MAFVENWWTSARSLPYVIRVQIAEREPRVPAPPPIPDDRGDPGLRVIGLGCAIRRGGAVITGSCRDLSPGGISLSCKDPVALGAQLELELELLFEEEHRSEALRLFAEVVWCSALDGAFQIGAKFVGLSPQVREYLGVFLDFLDVPHPAAPIAARG
jgi:hypothetical protein